MSTSGGGGFGPGGFVLDSQLSTRYDDDDYGLRGTGSPE